MKKNIIAIVAAIFLSCFMVSFSINHNPGNDQIDSEITREIVPPTLPDELPEIIPLYWIEYDENGEEINKWDVYRFIFINGIFVGVPELIDENADLDGQMSEDKKSVDLIYGEYTILCKDKEIGKIVKTKTLDQ